jgi:hypothetical protein
MVMFSGYECLCSHVIIYISLKYGYVLSGYVLRLFSKFYLAVVMFSGYVCLCSYTHKTHIVLRLCKVSVSFQLSNFQISLSVMGLLYPCCIRGVIHAKNIPSKVIGQQDLSILEKQQGKYWSIQSSDYI